MPNPFIAPVVGWASRLRFPTLFKLTVALLLVSWVVPDPIPFLDEIVTALAVLLFGSWKQGDRPPPGGPGADGGSGGPDDRVIEGESRRE